jgi:hypothetical protein
MTQTLERQITEAQAYNWAILIQDKVARLVKEHINDIDLSVKILNGEFYDMAQEEFSREKAQGLWDGQNIWIGG